MLRANLLEINLIDSRYKSIVEFFTKFNHALVNFSESELVFDTTDKSFKYNLTLYEEEIMTKTFLSEFQDGTPFRVIKPIGVAKEKTMIKYNTIDAFTVGSVNPDGYSLLFLLTEKNDIRNQEVMFKNPDEQLQKLVDVAITAMKFNLETQFYDFCRRILSNVKGTNKNLNQLENGKVIVGILKNKIKNFDENEQQIISKL